MKKVFKYIRRQIVVLYIRVKYEKELFMMIKESKFVIGEVLVFNGEEKGIVVKNDRGERSGLYYVSILHINSSTEKFKKWVCI